MYHSKTVINSKHCCQLFNSKKRPHHTSAVLHWLTVTSKISFKILLLVFRALSSQPLNPLTTFVPGCCLRPSSRALLHQRRHGHSCSVPSPVGLPAWNCCQSAWADIDCFFTLFFYTAFLHWYTGLLFKYHRHLAQYRTIWNLNKMLKISK